MTPIKYDPSTGTLLSPTADKNPASWRDATWHFNPWSGAKRSLKMVVDDPQGAYAHPPVEELAGNPCPDCGVTEGTLHKRWCPKLPDHVREPLVLPPATAEQRELSALDRQEGGGHYKGLKIQPIEYIHANGIPFAEGSVIKYVSRWRSKGGVEDLKKARHFLDLLIELESRSA